MTTTKTDGSNRETNEISIEKQFQAEKVIFFLLFNGINLKESYLTLFSRCKKLGKKIARVSRFISGRSRIAHFQISFTTFFIAEFLKIIAI